MDANDYLIEIYLKDDKLVCVHARTTDKTDSQGVIRSVPYTVAETCDVSDPANPISLGEMSQSGSFHTMRVSGDYMYLTTDKTDSQGVIRSVPYTVAETCDVSDPANPISLGEMSQSGSFHTMRVSGDYMYLLSMFYADISGPKDDISSYVPEVQGKLIESNYILLPQQEKGRVRTISAVMYRKYREN